MHPRSKIANFVGIALAMLSGMYAPRLKAEQDRASGNRRSNHGKGKGRYGARKPVQHVRHSRAPAGKPARRRRRAANLRRG